MADCIAIYLLNEFFANQSAACSNMCTFWRKMADINWDKVRKQNTYMGAINE